MRAALSFDLRKNKVIGDRFCSSNTLRLRGCINLEIFTEEAKDYTRLPIRQAHDNNRFAIKYERLLLNWKQILLFVQHAPRKGNVSCITLFQKTERECLAALQAWSR